MVIEKLLLQGAIEALTARVHFGCSREGMPLGDPCHLGGLGELSRELRPERDGQGWWTHAVQAEKRRALLSGGGALGAPFEGLENPNPKRHTGFSSRGTPTGRARDRKILKIL